MPSSLLPFTPGLNAQSGALLAELPPQVLKIGIYRWHAIHERTVLTWQICSHPQAEVLLWRRDGEKCPVPTWSFNTFTWYLCWMCRGTEPMAMPERRNSRLSENLQESEKVWLGEIGWRKPWWTGGHAVQAGWLLLTSSQWRPCEKAGSDFPELPAVRRSENLNLAFKSLHFQMLLEKCRNEILKSIMCLCVCMYV